MYDNHIFLVVFLSLAKEPIGNSRFQIYDLDLIESENAAFIEKTF